MTTLPNGGFWILYSDIFLILVGEVPISYFFAFCGWVTLLNTVNSDCQIDFVTHLVSLCSMSPQCSLYLANVSDGQEYEIFAAKLSEKTEI